MQYGNNKYVLVFTMGFLTTRKYIKKIQICYLPLTLYHLIGCNVSVTLLLYPISVLKTHEKRFRTELTRADSGGLLRHYRLSASTASAVLTPHQLIQPLRLIDCKQKSR